MILRDTQQKYSMYTEHNNRNETKTGENIASRKTSQELFEESINMLKAKLDVSNTEDKND